MIFIQYYKVIGLQPNWSMITLIGGIGIGKSRFSYENWNILLDFIQNNQLKCLEYLQNDKDIFSQFKKFITPNSIIEVFIKDINNDRIKVNESIESHLKYCLSSCLFKTFPNSREYKN